jgi:predicted transposase YbfD/YdcC
LSKKTLEVCKEAGIIPIFQVKKNQKTLLNNFQHHIKFTQPIKTITNKDKPWKCHGRIEIREIRTYKPNTKNYGQLGFITDVDWRKAIKVIIEITRIIKTKDTAKSTKDNPVYKTTTEKAFYFTTTATLSAKQLKDIIQNHWGIENSNHSVRDVSLKEDQSRIRNNPLGFATIRSTAMNIIRTLKTTINPMLKPTINKTKQTVNIAKTLRCNAWSDTFFDDYKGLWTSG